MKKQIAIKEFIIDGNIFSNIEEFYNEVQMVLTDNFTGFGRNLDAFDDILYGDLGRFDSKEKIILIWKNFEKSKISLNSKFLKQILEIIKSHKNILLRIINT